MDHQSIITPWDLECLLCDETAEPQALPLLLLKEITNSFSDEQEIGRGGFAVVYKGKLKNRTVAVKRSTMYMHEKEFHREVACLMMVKHKNIVRFLGYCSDTQGTMARDGGKFVMADVQQRLLCFEYLPNGSLHEFITDKTRKLWWRDCYQIITGICQGLHYLHQNNILHLDLKPANILLDDDWVPKIADFGLSRCFEEMQSRVITTNIVGTLGYLAPEFASKEITYKFDIYSLGVTIIEILTGEKGRHDVDNVVESWSKSLDKSQSELQQEQLRVCAKIGIECTDFNPVKRPDTRNIINRLVKAKTMDVSIETAMITSLQKEMIVRRVENAAKDLHAKGNDVRREIANAERQHRTPTFWLKIWLKKVDSIIRDVEVISADCRLLKKDVTMMASEKLREVQECLRTCPSIVVVESMSLPVQEMRSLSLQSAQDGTLRLPDASDLCHLQTLVVFHTGIIANISELFKYKLLEVLDLKKSSALTNEDVKKICDLLQLRCLSLGDSIDEVPRDIAKLQLLQTLDMTKTKTVYMPVEVMELPELEHLIGKFQLYEHDITNKKYKQLSSTTSKLERLSGFVISNSKESRQLLRRMEKLKKVKIWYYAKDWTADGSLAISRIYNISGHSLSIECTKLPKEIVESLENASKLTSLKLRGDLRTLLDFQGRELTGIQELCLSGTNLRAGEIIRVVNLFIGLKYLKLVEYNLGPLRIPADCLYSLTKLCLVATGTLSDITIQDGGLYCLVSLHMLFCKQENLEGIDITSLKHLKEIGLHSGVDQVIKEDWQARASEHGNKPKVVLIQRPGFE